MDRFRSRRRALKALALAPFAGALGACGSGGAATTAPATRSWKMGFFPSPPRLTFADLTLTLDKISARAEIAHIHEELPWTDLLNGLSADAVVDKNKTAFVGLLRGKGLRIGFMADLTDGLSRGQEPPQLRQLGRSIAEPAVQQAYRSYVLSFVRKLQPDYIGLAAETNLTRMAAPAPLYAAVVQAANAAAGDLAAAGVAAPLMVSVQAEVAWGQLGGGGSFVGVDADFRDFPFVRMLGLSSYPYFAFPQPESLPDDYYSRILSGRAIAAMVAEGGWTSAGGGSFSSSPEEQARYIARQSELLDGIGATAVVQTLYADLDPASFAPPAPADLALFADIGLVDSNYSAKPAQAVWDSLYGRPLA